MSATTILKCVLNHELDRVFQALADPSRRLMVERLSRGPASVSELARPFSMSLAAVVQHVQVLEACGLVRSEKVGRVRTCQIAPATLHSTLPLWIVMTVLEAAAAVTAILLVRRVTAMQTAAATAPSTAT